MRQILLHIQICNSPSLVGWHLCLVEKPSQQMFRPQPSGRSQAFSEIMACDNKSLRPTAGVSSLMRGHLEILAHWALISPDPPVGLAATAHAGATFVLLFISVHFWHLCMCSEPGPVGLPVYALEQLEFSLSMVTFENLFHIFYFTKVI